MNYTKVTTRNNNRKASQSIDFANDDSIKLCSFGNSKYVSMKEKKFKVEPMLW